MTLELPWRNNKPNVSCVPPGTYPYYLEQGRFRIFIENVPDRTGIQIHAGNHAKDIQGCILLGNNFFYDKDEGSGVSNSLNVVRPFISLLWQFGLKRGKLIIKG